MKVYNCVSFYLPEIEERFLDAVIFWPSGHSSELEDFTTCLSVPLFIPGALAIVGDFYGITDNHSLTFTGAIIFSAPSLQLSTYILITWILLLFETVLFPKGPVEAASLN